MGDPTWDADHDDVAPFNDCDSLLTLVDTVSYYLFLKMTLLEKGATLELPDEVDELIDLARHLPPPLAEEWGSLAVGRVSMKRKPKRMRGSWTPEAKLELVKLVEDDRLRERTVGRGGTNADGSVNWLSLAKRYGFLTPATVQKCYEDIKKKEDDGEDDEQVERRRDNRRLVRSDHKRSPPRFAG